MKWKREDLKAWTKIPTRWKDHDIYGHVNNVVYYSYFDTAVIGNLIRSTGNDIRNLEAIGTVVESGCTFHKEIRFPQIIAAGTHPFSKWEEQLVTNNERYMGKKAIATFGELSRIEARITSPQPILSGSIL